MASTTARTDYPIEFFVDGRDNGFLGKVYEYLDPVSLHAWGQAVLTATKGSADRAGLLEDIGTALLDRTILPLHGFTCVDFQGLFQDPDVLTEDESKPETEVEARSSNGGENLKRLHRLTFCPNPNWTRKRHFIANSKNKNDAKELDNVCQMLTCCFEKVDGLKDLNDIEIGYFSRFLAIAATKACNCSQFKWKSFVCLEAVVEALCLMNIKFSFPLEKCYTLKLMEEITQPSHSETLISSTEVIGTLGELATFNRTFFNGESVIRAGAPRWRPPFQLCYPVDRFMEAKLSHEEQVSQLQASIEQHIVESGEPDLKHFREDIMDDLRRDLRVQERKQMQCTTLTTIFGSLGIWGGKALW